jgi:hypothetical protein
MAPVGEKARKLFGSTVAGDRESQAFRSITHSKPPPCQGWRLGHVPAGSLESLGEVVAQDAPVVVVERVPGFEVKVVGHLGFDGEREARHGERPSRKVNEPGEYVW